MPSLVNSCSVENAEEVKKLISTLNFAEYKEKFLTQELEGISIDDFDEIVDDLQLEVSMDDGSKKQILRGKMTRKNEKFFSDFAYKSGGPGQFFYGKTLSVKDDNEEMTFASIFYRVDFKLYPNKGSMPRGEILSFLFGSSSNNDQPLDTNQDECMKKYFRKKCSDYLLKEYPNMAKLTIAKQ